MDLKRRLIRRRVMAEKRFPTAFSHGAEATDPPWDAYGFRSYPE